jgi:RNA polymerase sigma-70 factor (ECF subfamily)
VTAADGDLLARLRDGDEAAFVMVVRAYQPQLLRLARTMVGSAAVAEEVVQDTWLGVIRGIERFEGRCTLKTWLFRIAANRARSAGGRERRDTALPLDDEQAWSASHFDGKGAWSSPPVPWADEADDRIVAVQLAKRARASLDELPPGQREVVLLRDVEGLSPSEVCTVLGITDGNQRVLLHRGRARVRRLLDADLGRS